MSHPLYVAFIWHQHQPQYRSAEAKEDGLGQYRLPWARLHGTKDYLDLALILAKYPELHHTFNLVPSLILQLEDYANDTARDPYLSLTLKSISQLTLEQKTFVVERFFDGHHRTLIDPHPRYSELYQQQQIEGTQWCLEHWQEPEFSDLLAWHNLAWIDPLFWDDPVIANWLTRGRGFTLRDREQIWQKQREIIARILPQHKAMQDAGQIEVITTPYTHPILPLLGDSQAGRVAVPRMRLPSERFAWREDVSRHLRKARELYRDRFGKHPVGLWPSEQSVSPEILPPVAKAGFQWLCSDEGVLGWSLDRFFHRDEWGNLQEPELLYRPYRIETPHGSLNMVFRDHRLSDLIGFTYSAMEPEHAVNDLIGHLDAIAYQLRNKEGHSQERSDLSRPWLVTIALDGENCWEFYEKDGLPFLDKLYQRLSEHPGLRCLTVNEFLQAFPPQTTVPLCNLHSGSWIDANFTTWIGDPAKNRGWEMLAEARNVLAVHPEATEETNPAAWNALFAAEGSDWFWWFGEGHSSEHDELFDQLFREHLRSLYRALNEEIPAYLFEPVESHQVHQNRPPEGFIHPEINGIADGQDWEKAGRIEIGGARGTMHQSTLIQRAWYGSDHLNFYLRVDFKAGLQPGAELPRELHLYWYYPNRTAHTSTISLQNTPNEPPLNYRFRHHLGIDMMTGWTWLNSADREDQWQSLPTKAHAAFDQCLEVAVPWHDIHTEPDTLIHLVAVLSAEGKYCDYLPENQVIELANP